MQAQVKDIFCIYNPSAFDYKVKVSTDSNTVVGLHLRIVSPDKKVIFQDISLSLDNNSSEYHTIKKPVKGFNRCFLVWSGLACSTDISRREGRVRIELFNDGTPCIMPEPAESTIDHLTPCEMNNPVKFSGSLMFIGKT